MRRSLLAAGAALALLAFCSPAPAQTASEVELTRAEIQTDRQLIIDASLGLTEDEARAFWPVYRDYRHEMARVGDRLVKLIENYARQRDSMTDEQATTLLSEYLSIQSDDLAVRKKYARPFGKVVSPRKVARFYQIENKLDAIVRFDLASVIPLVR